MKRPCGKNISGMFNKKTFRLVWLELSEQGEERGVGCGAVQTLVPLRLL